MSEAESKHSICREIFKAIHEGRWLSIEYQNKENKITKYWNKCSCFLFCYYIFITEHRSVRHTSQNILTIHFTVKWYRRIEIVCCFIGKTADPTRPHFCHTFSPNGKSSRTYETIKVFISLRQLTPEP